MEGAAWNEDICWVASYPRSGNTFLRIALCQILFGPQGNRELNTAIPEYVFPGRAELGSARPVTSRGGQIVFAKTHFHSPPDIGASKAVHAVYLYRQPMDVFLSGLNYIYINAGNNDEFRRYFLNHAPVSVDEIHAAGDLEYYFNRFIEDDGLAPFSRFSGRWTQNIAQWHQAAAARPTIRCSNYAEMVAEPEAFMASLLDRIRVDVAADAVQQGIAQARAATKVDGKFYWKGRSGTYRSFLSDVQVRRYEARYGAVLEAVGVHCFD